MGVASTLKVQADQVINNLVNLRTLAIAYRFIVDEEVN